MRRRHWIVVSILALLFHALILLPKIPGFDLFSTPKPRVQIQQVDPAKLDAIRKQWKSRERQLLLDKNLKAQTSKEAPENARFWSDRNMKVEKEQRAKHATVMPKPGAHGEPSAKAPPQPKTEPHTKTQPSKSTLPNLGSLGVPLPAAPRKQAPRPPVQQASHLSGNSVNGGEDGGDQAIRDPSLPEGSENMLNAQESVYYSFYSRLYETIGPIWQSKIRQAARTRRLQPGEYVTSVDVVFDREGNLIDVRQIKGSGVDSFDQAASASWQSIGRFPNPPEGLLDAEGQVHTGWTFAVQLNEGMNLQSLPPERVY